MRVKQGNFLASPAWPQPRLPLGQSCYASLPFKQMRKCSSSLPNDLFGPEPRQVSFQPMRPGVPPTQLLLACHCQAAGHSRAPKSSQSHNHLGHQKELTSCSPKCPNPFNNLHSKVCLSAPMHGTPCSGEGVIGPGGLCCKRLLQEVLVSKRVERPWVIWVGCFPCSWSWGERGGLDIPSPNPPRGSNPGSVQSV